jgi:AcrR family transcriptional regulator
MPVELNTERVVPNQSRTGEQTLTHACSYPGTVKNEESARPPSTRDRLLDAAARVIRERGITGATIREIARAAGVAEGSVYNHFRDKNELITAVHLERMTALKLSQAVHRLVTSVGRGSVAAHLEALAADAVAAYAELVPFSASLAADADAAAPVRRELTRRRLGPFRAHEAVAAYLRIEEEQGRLELRMPPLITSASLLGACHEYAFLQLFGDDVPFGTEVARFARQLVEALVLVTGAEAH